MAIGATKIFQIENGANEQISEKLAFRSAVAVEMGLFSDRLI